MKNRLTAVTLSALMIPAAAIADPLQVVTDIAPIHSLTARVMDGVGTPDLLLPPDVSPHGFALRPSDARRLSDADVVIWTGARLTPYLADPVASLATSARALELLETDGWPMRYFDDADAHDHDAHGDDDHTDKHAPEEHGEQQADEHSHDDHAHEDGDHDADHDGAEGHDHDAHDHLHEGLDPHAWLDPAVARAWTHEIAELLAQADPENAAQYRANAEASEAELDALQAEIAAQLDGVSGNYVVPHNAYGYFSDRFGLEAAGSIADHDATAPGPARIAALRDELAQSGVSCVLSDASVSADWTRLLAEGTKARTGVLDPIGRNQTPGAALYPAVLRQIAGTLVECLAQ